MENPQANHPLSHSFKKCVKKERVARPSATAPQKKILLSLRTTLLWRLLGRLVAASSAVLGLITRRKAAESGDENRYSHPCGNSDDDGSKKHAASFLPTHYARGTTLKNCKIVLRTPKKHHHHTDELCFCQYKNCCYFFTIRRCMCC